MTEDKQAGDDKAAAQPDRAEGSAALGSSTPAAEDAQRQDKTKDRPDSGQNEDG